MICKVDGPKMEEENTQTQTQNSQVEFTQASTPNIPNIYGRLYHTKISLNGKHCWKNSHNPEYIDLTQSEFSLGRALHCTFVMKKDMIKDNIIKNISKQHFRITRDMSESLCPAIITDLSYNGTFVNGEKIGKGNSRVLDDNDEISVTHPIVKIFVFKDLLKNEQDQVPKEVSQKYYISRTLGQGACGLVKLVYDKKRCTKHAMKMIKKCKLTNGKMTHLNNPLKIMNEINIMKALRHPCIISTEEVFDSKEAVYIILELMRGGELFDRITKYGHLSEQLTRFLFRQMVLAVKYLHSQGITHRDLKPENVLLDGQDDETLVKITDFGLSKFVGEDSFMKTMCGTPLYLAPEVLRANEQNCYGPEVDVWSLGVIFFVCLVGYLPFSAEYKEMSLKDQILTGRYKFAPDHWKGVSLQAKLLMKRMLTVQVNRRITLDQILNHTWMQDPNVIIRVEKLLSYTMLEKKISSQLTISAYTDEENSSSKCEGGTAPWWAAGAGDKCEGGTAPRRAAGAGAGAGSKRALADACGSCQPHPKKLRLASYRDNCNDTNSTSSYCSD